LGHLISESRVKPDPEEIAVLQQWPKPVSLKELRGFLGISGYYRWFIQGCGKMAAPLTMLFFEKYSIYLG